jgi:2-enoate reductase
MEERGIKMMASTVAKEIKDGRLVVSEDMNPNRPDGLCTWTPIVKNLPAAPLKQMPEDKVLEADFLVVAMGGKAEESMFLEGQKTSVAPEIYNIGDSYKMGRILEANNAAYAAAMNL